MKYFLDLNGEFVNVSEAAYVWALSQIPESEREGRVQVRGTEPHAIVILKVLIK